MLVIEIQLLWEPYRVEGSWNSASPLIQKETFQYLYPMPICSHQKAQNLATDSLVYQIYTNICSNYPSEDSKIPWSTDLSALAAVAPIQIMNPNRWKLGSPWEDKLKRIRKK